MPFAFRTKMLLGLRGIVVAAGRHARRVTGRAAVGVGVHVKAVLAGRELLEVRLDDEPVRPVRQRDRAD